MIVNKKESEHTLIFERLEYLILQLVRILFRWKCSVNPRKDPLLLNVSHLFCSIIYLSLCYDISETKHQYRYISNSFSA